MHPASKWPLVTFGLFSTLGFVGLAVLAWGDWESFFAHPARLGVSVAALLLVFVSAFSDVNLSSGKRADAGDLWIVLPTLLLNVLCGWLPAFTERRGMLTLIGSAPGGSSH